MKYIVTNCVLALLLLVVALLSGENSLWLGSVIIINHCYMVGRLDYFEKLIKSQGEAL